MARSTLQILLQLERQLPDWMRPLRPHLAGIAAMLADCEQRGEQFADATTVAGADGIWLSLLARGYGVVRSTGETDASVRRRLRHPDRALTRRSILEAVNALLQDAGAGDAVMLEPWDEGFADRDAWADRTVMASAHNSFVLVIPLVGEAVSGDSYADWDYADVGAYAGSDGEDPLYQALVAMVDGLRAAGVRWWIAIDVDGYYTS